MACCTVPVFLLRQARSTTPQRQRMGAEATPHTTPKEVGKSEDAIDRNPLQAPMRRTVDTVTVNWIHTARTSQGLQLRMSSRARRKLDGITLVGPGERWRNGRECIERVLREQPESHERNIEHERDRCCAEASTVVTKKHRDWGEMSASASVSVGERWPGEGRCKMSGPSAIRARILC